MNKTASVYKKSVGTSILLALGLSVSASLFTVKGAKAQQSATGTTIGTIVGIDESESACSLIVANNGGGGTFTLAAGAEICEKALAGQRIQYTPEITQLEVIPAPTVATVMSAESGDRICYVSLQDANGQVTNHYAGFNICAQNLVGAQVRLTYNTGNILDYSCQGDIGCGKSDLAQLIASVEVITPPPAPTRLPISSLPDGNYRFWNGSSPNAVVSDSEITGGALFLFQKRGNNITGIFGYFDQEALCVQGQVNEDTVTGTSVQNLSGARVISTGETFKNFGPDSSVQVRRGRQIDSNTVRYSSTLLNLTGLNRINAGPRLPPSRC